MNKLRKIQSFSLVELMVVIAIIGILSAIAVPSYRTYIIRSKFVEIITIMQSKQTEILQAYFATGVMQDATYANFNNVSAFVASAMSSTNLHIGVHLADNAIYPGTGIRQLNIQMMDINDIIKVACYADSRNGANTIPVSYLPSGCNGTPQNPTSYVIP